jgi:uroporphyrinogen-III synthase
MKTLAGVRIVVTRAAAQASELADPLHAAGAHVAVCPLIRMQPTADAAQLNRVLATLNEFAWVVFTSSNGVEQLFAQLREAKLDATALAAARIACVGPITAAAAAGRGLASDVVPDEFSGEGLAHALNFAGTIQGKRILLARAAGGGEALPAQLRARGADVEDLQLYKSVLDEQGAARLAALLNEERVDLITFTAGSAVTYFVQSVGSSRTAAVAVIGPSTAEVARRHGLRVDIEATPHTTAGLVNAIQDYYAAGRGHRRI